MRQVKITQIGEKAIASNEPILVLFNNSATDELKKIALIHEDLDEAKSFNVKDGDKVLFDNKEYLVEKAGEMVNQSLELLGHTTLVFHEPTEKYELPNSLYLSPAELPSIQEGTIISFVEG